MPDLRLPLYVTVRAGKYFYFRRAKAGAGGKQDVSYIRLPHPLSPEFKKAYNRAWFETFGIWPEDSAPPTSVLTLVERHKAESQSYRLLSESSRQFRDRAGALLVDRWGDFDARDIKPVHCQALYDKIADRPATANRLWDDVVQFFAWGVPRGFCERNPATEIERVRNEGAYEPWPSKPLAVLLHRGQWHIARVALLAVYTGQDRGDLLTQLTDAQLDGDEWTLRRAKTRRKVRDDIVIALHPAAMMVVEECRAEKRAAGIVDPDRPLLTNSRGEPWGKGFGASWTKELKRLGLDAHEPRLTFKGLRATNATMIADAAAHPDETASEAFARVKAQLGHHSERMSAHYARKAEVRKTTRGNVSRLPNLMKNRTETERDSDK